MERCLVCGECYKKIDRKVKDETLKYKHKTVVVPNTVSFTCSACGECFFGGVSEKTLDATWDRLRAEVNRENPD